MARGFAAGFLKHEGRWIRYWVDVNQPGRTRALTLEEAKTEIVRYLGLYCGGEAVAKRKAVFVDAICADGRELLETLFEATRESTQEPAPEGA